MKKLLISLTVIALISSCKKEEITDCSPNNEPSSPEKGYFPLSIGSYWVYENYFIDSLENEIQLSEQDSVIIKNDTLINGNHYLVFKTYNTAGYQIKLDQIVRDSSGYIVNQHGEIMFSATNFSDTLRAFAEISYPADTIYTASFQMEDNGDHVTVPAGTFKAINYKGSYNIYPKHQTSSNPWSTGVYYAKNVGMVLDYYYYIAIKQRAERRLVRYHIN